jgi:EAL domain-containing protein (putative c-di-GMP-specific phosphodiesterase class I)
MSLPGSLSGRATPSIADTAALVDRITMEAELRDALVAGDLVLRYQPIVELDSGRIMAFETLCRWRHWSKGLLGPAEFMPLAEETGLIVPLGGCVLEESCRRLALWRSRFTAATAVDVTVNLSPAELRDRGLVDRAAHALDASRLPAGRLVVEVSEAAAFAAPQGPARDNLGALAELGVGIAIDDIGVPRPGSPSGRPDPEGWLWGLPLRMVKIERGVALRLTGGAGRAERVLTTTRRLAAERGVAVVAKGIETAEQVELFRALGCPAGQGFFFARPMDPTDAEAYLRRTSSRGRA